VVDAAHSRLSPIVLTAGDIVDTQHLSLLTRPLSLKFSHLDFT